MALLYGPSWPTYCNHTIKIRERLPYKNLTSPYFLHIRAAMRLEFLGRVRNFGVNICVRKQLKQVQCSEF